MQLIGMLDSPYVRRTAISFHVLEIPFEHKAVSVFSTFDKFQKINPVVKAPSLVCDNGDVLMDSSLIIDYGEFIAAPGKSLLPSTLSERQRDLYVIGLALAACEKSVQMIYETNLRPVEKQHEPWLARVRGQVLAAYSLLEQALTRKPLTEANQILSQAGISTAVAWRFTQMMLPDIVQEADHPALKAHSARAENTEAFLAFPPDGPDVPSSD